MGKTQLHPDEDQIHFMFPKQVKLIVSKINPLETSGMFIYSHSNYCGILVTLFCIIYTFPQLPSCVTFCSLSSLFLSQIVFLNPQLKRRIEARIEGIWVKKTTCFPNLGLILDAQLICLALGSPCSALSSAPHQGPLFKHSPAAYLSKARWASFNA